MFIEQKGQQWVLTKAPRSPYHLVATDDLPLGFGVFFPELGELYDWGWSELTTELLSIGYPQGPVSNGRSYAHFFPCVTNIDVWNMEVVVRRLKELDPEGKDYMVSGHILYIETVDANAQINPAGLYVLTALQYLKTQHPVLDEDSFSEWEYGLIQNQIINILRPHGLVTLKRANQILEAEWAKCPRCENTILQNEAWGDSDYRNDIMSILVEEWTGKVVSDE